MKTTGLATAISGVTAAAAAAGPTVLVALGGLLVLITIVYCWIIASRTRTGNTVRIIDAFRRQANELPAGQSPRSRGQLSRSRRR
ncbi:hypothetical protein KRMM14A1259_21810 [Krasilnikovia sp. MM14-A1259]